jgi:cyanophycin synthetase
VATALIELRLLDGPNLYFPRAAVKLTLDLTTLVEADEDEAAGFADRLGLRDARPGPAGTGFRQRFAARAVARLVRQVAAGAGTHRLAVRVRPDRDVDRVVVAYPWRHRSRAEAVGRAVAEVLDSLPVADLDELVDRVAAQVRDADLGSAPRAVHPRIPVVAVTGSHGKTSTCRIIEHLGKASGRCVGRSSTEGIHVDGVLVDPGDYSGPGGAGRLLVRPEVELAVTETAPGSILLGGIGVTHNDVSVVTNVDPDSARAADPDADHRLGTVDHLADLKSVVTRITRSDGCCVLNGDDPRAWSMRVLSPARPWAFSRDPDSPAVRDMFEHGGTATTVIDGWIAVVEAGHDPDPLLRLADAPLTARHPAAYAVENALAATSAALALGLPRAAVVEGLATFDD